MAPPVTELATLPLKAGTDVTDPNTTAGTVWQDTLNEVLSQDGAQRAYWGTQVESPNILMLFIDWETHDAHKKFMASASYDAFVKRLLTLLDGGPALHHVPFTPHPARAALSDTTSPATEVLTVFFPTSYSEADQQKFESNMKELVGALEKNADGFKGSAAGWAIEEVDNAKAEGGKAKAFVAVIGWQSVKHHHDFRENKAFKDNIHLLRDAKDLVGFEVFHVPFLEVQGPGPLSGEERGVSRDAQEEILNPQDATKNPPKTASDGTTTKNSDPGAANALHKERAGR